jgi:YggT family protein
MLNPFIELISMAIGLIELALFIWIIMSLLIQFDIINAHQPLISRVRYFLERVLNPLLSPIRRYVPTVGGFDLSPIVLILALRFIDSALFHWFYNV